MAKSRPTLYYFTESYPYGISEQWKRNELEVFREYFERIVVIPRSYGGNPVARNLVDGVEYREPLIDPNITRSSFEKAWIQFSGVWSTWFTQAFMEALFSGSKAGLARIVKYAYQVALINQNPSVREALRSRNSVFYFYWGIGSADIVPFIRGGKQLKACRFHGWDLYEDRHPGGRIPFRRELMDSLDLILPCSDFGAKYLSARYPDSQKKIHTARLGTISCGRTPVVDDGVLKIVTCSSVTRVKRLDRLCAALATMSIPTRWTHIGDGDLMGEIQSLAANFGPNVSVEFVGNLESQDVLRYLSDHVFDLFVNVSDSEGVPVSIMEALSAGIPVYATDVGGTSEIVDDSVGKTIPAESTPEQIANELTAFHQLPADQKLKMRNAATARYEEMANATVNARRLAELIISKANEKK